MQERLQKIISAAGIASRRAAEELILEGRVRVNGKVVTELGSKADPEKDHIKVDGKLINPKQPPTYLMLNKPAGYVTTMSDPEGRPTVQDLLKGVKTRVYPVGRLDYNTEGLLLLTNDGDFAHLITHPKHEFPKTYLVKVKGVLDENAIEMLEKGVFLQDGKTAPAKVKKVRKEEANSWVEITIHEGRKRQVRRMFDHVGRSVIKLKRIRTGSLSLGNLPEGNFRHLTLDEVNALRETAMKTDDSGQQVRVYKPVVSTKIYEEGLSRGGPDKGRGGRPGTGRSVRPSLSDASRREHKKSLTIRESSVRRPEVRKPGSEESRSTWPGRKPKTEERRVRTTGSSPRTGRAYGASTKPATGSGTWKSKSRPKPGHGFSGRGPARGGSFEGRRTSSGPRPNKSTFTGSKGPARGVRPASKGRGQEGGRRGPRR